MKTVEFFKSKEMVGFYIPVGNPLEDRSGTYVLASEANAEIARLSQVPTPDGFGETIDRLNERIKVLEAELKHCQGSEGWSKMMAMEGHIESLEAERDKLRLENEVLESMSRHSPSPCGHSSQYAYTDDGGKHIVCLLCSRTSHAALVEKLLPGNLVDGEIYKLLDNLYQRGWTDKWKNINYDSRGTNEYQAILDSIKAALVEVK